MLASSVQGKRSRKAICELRFSRERLPAELKTDTCCKTTLSLTLVGVDAGVLVGVDVAKVRPNAAASNPSGNVVSESY